MPTTLSEKYPNIKKTIRSVTKKLDTLMVRLVSVVNCQNISTLIKIYADLASQSITLILRAKCA
jgi:hypothetical protein